MPLAGLVTDLGADLGHRLLDLDPGLGDVGDERVGERAVGAGFAIERGLAGTGGKGNQRALSRLHLGEASLHIDGAGGLGRADLRRERIVTAGIQEYELHLRVRHRLIEREVDIDRRAQLDVHLGFQVCVDRQQVVHAVHGDPVAGIKEYRDIGAFTLLAELEKLCSHGVAGEVGALDDIESDIAQHPGHRPGIDCGVGELRDILIGGVPDDEGDALVRQSCVAADNECCD